MTNRRGAGARARCAVGALLAALLLGLAGCVDVPTSGPIEKVGGQQPACENCVNVEVSPPAPGTDPQTIVLNYLRANANYQPNYAVAKQYLTQAAAAKWSPDVGVTIYDGSTKEGDRDQIILSGEQVGFLDAYQTYNAQPIKLETKFDLELEGGEWRINTPPPGLFVAQSAFKDLYKPYNLYFVGSAESLVPQSIYLPNLRNPDNVATALVKGLLAGPSIWLSPAVSTVIPVGTKLSGDAVTITGGVAQVSLTDQVQQLTDLQRTELAAQLVYTLQQVSGVKKVLLLVGNQPFHVPESAPDDQAVPVGSIPPELDPIPFVGAERLYAVQHGRLGMVSANADDPQIAPVSGELGDGSLTIDAVAVSVTNSSLAVVTNGGTVLREAAADGSKLTTLLTGVTRLLRPQLSRDDRLWAAGDRDGRQQMWLVGTGVSTEVPVQALGRGRLVAFRISPDGTRLAMLIERDGRTTLGLGRIVRGESGTKVTGWRELDTRPTGTSRSARTVLRDVAWTDASNLIVLRGDRAGGPFVPVELSDDGSQLSPEQPAPDWDGRALTVLLRTKTPLVLTADGEVRRNDGTAWVPYLSRVGAVACPG